MNESKIPKLLQEIPDSPKKLYRIGNFPDEQDNIFLCVIGSRKYSSYGKNVIEKILSELAGYPFVIISGLALGIDSLAHKAALENKLLSIAVPGSGLDNSVLYPSSNRKLAHRILENNGCLISEFEPETKAAPWTFPMRNRIMAGLSHAVLVIEAENKSGTRITARLATDYNREVFSVPGSIFSDTSSGANELIREGATPITSGKDILKYFGLLNKEKIKQKELILNKDEQKIFKTLDEAKTRNQLAKELNLPIFKLNILLSSMEIRSLIQESMGKIHKIHKD